MLFLVTGGVFCGSEVHPAPGAIQDVEGVTRGTRGQGQVLLPRRVRADCRVMGLCHVTRMCWLALSQPLRIEGSPEFAATVPQLLLRELDPHSIPWRQVCTAVFIREMGKLRPGVPQRLNVCRKSQQLTLPAVLFGVPTAAPVLNEESALGPLGCWLLRERSWVGSHGGRKGRRYLGWGTLLGGAKLRREASSSGHREGDRYTC